MRARIATSRFLVTNVDRRRLASVVSTSTAMTSSTAPTTTASVQNVPMASRSTPIAGTKLPQSMTGLNGRSRTLKNPMSSTFATPTNPSNAPTAPATMRLARAGRTSSKATTTRPSIGIRRNDSGVSKSKRLGANAANQTRHNALAVPAQTTAVRTVRREEVAGPSKSVVPTSVVPTSAGTLGTSAEPPAAFKTSIEAARGLSSPVRNTALVFGKSVAAISLKALSRIAPKIIVIGCLTNSFKKSRNARAAARLCAPSKRIDGGPCQNSKRPGCVADSIPHLTASLEISKPRSRNASAKATATAAFVTWCRPRRPSRTSSKCCSLV